MLHTVDVWLDDAERAVVGELDQALVSNRAFQIAVDVKQGYQAILGGGINRREARPAPDESFLHDAPGNARSGPEPGAIGSGIIHAL